MNNPNPFSTIILDRNDLKFSAGHFTIFSATERERLHGHNFQVRVEITAKLQDSGITYDYGITRKQIMALCRSLNEYMLLPQYSPYLSISEDDRCYYAVFNGEQMSFLKSDTKVLPIKNVTSEALSGWFVEQLTADEMDLHRKHIETIKVMISVTVGQSASALWEKSTHE